jgi:Tfp pilus assembly protein PilN
MLAWWLILLLVTASPAPASAQTLKELFLDAERSKLAALQDEIRALAERKQRTRTDVARLRGLREEIRQVEGRLKVLDNAAGRSR